MRFGRRRVFLRLKHYTTNTLQSGSVRVLFMCGLGGGPCRTGVSIQRVLCCLIDVCSLFVDLVGLALVLFVYHLTRPLFYPGPFV